MHTYHLPKKIRETMAQNEPAVKAALSKIANKEFGIQGLPQGIGKYEGGIKVNNREIAIRHNYVMDDWHKTQRQTPEETAVVKAIEEVKSIILRHGIKAVKARYGECTLGDPLRDLIAGP